MQIELQRVLALQPSWSRGRSPQMDERGRLVRDAIPARLAAHRSAIAEAAGIPEDDLLIEGRDGTGLKTRVPWVRFGSRAWSPSATNGFYVVYLFDARGDAVYLSLNQGTTDFDGGDYKPKPRPVVRARAAWGREAVATWRAERRDVGTVELHDRPGGLGDGYELGDVASVRYANGAVPDDEALLADAFAFGRALGAIYAAQRRSPLPFESPEAELVAEVAEAAAGKPRRAAGAGFRTDVEEIGEVERHAVALATAHYEALGWTVADVGRRKPYDLELSRSGAWLHVEVKGTTSDGMLVTLTEGEVRHHAKAYPNNALVVVSGIVLDRSGGVPRAALGALREIRPWRIEPAHLRAIAHRYTVPSADRRAADGQPSV